MYMTKGHALVWAIILSVCALALLVFQSYGFMLMFLGAGTFFFVAWLLKHNRDAKLIAEAKAEYQQNADLLPPPPATTTKGSNRLFVPPMLDK
jgi:hypothetical protein